MTTRVVIQNHGPDNVAIRQKNSAGVQTFPLTLIKPYEFKEFYVHNEQNLEVIEIKQG